MKVVILLVFLSLSFLFQAVEANTLKQGSFSGLYNRADWKHWVDADGDCQNTRAEVLIMQSMGRVAFTTSKRCSVKSGAWLDPYSGLSYSQASDLDIDHVVPLSWANGHGGSGWSKYQKRRFANDTSNLIAVGNKLNRVKGDKGPDEWLPPRHEYRCEYLVRFTAIVAKYRLVYVSSEKRVIDRMKKACRISSSVESSLSLDAKGNWVAESVTLPASILESLAVTLLS